MKITKKDHLYFKAILIKRCVFDLPCIDCPISSFNNKKRLACWKLNQNKRSITNDYEIRRKKITQYMIDKYGITATQCEIAEALL